MKNKIQFIRLLACIALLATLAGCVTTENISAADYGPAPANAEQQSREWLERVLKDPESARLKFGPLVKAVTKDGLVYGGKTHAGWVQIVEVNAKNSYGGYTGYKPYYLFFLGGAITADIYAGVQVGQMARLVP